MALPQKTSYSSLLKLVGKEIFKAQRNINFQKASTYWRIGRYISDYILQGQDRANYGHKVFDRLSQDLNVNPRVLERAVKFFREFPSPTTRQRLSWTHYTILLSVRDPVKRLEFQKRAEDHRLNIRQLRSEIALYNSGLRLEHLSDDPSLSIVRGKLYHYMTVSFSQQSISNDGVMIDCGFNFWRKVGRQEGVYSENAIFKTQKRGDEYSLSVSVDIDQTDVLFTYKAYLERVIDGDTIWIVIDVGFNNYCRQKVRLRRIDTPELTSPFGPEAKSFVEQKLSPLEFFVVKTYKYDKYTRYLVDVFYFPGESDVQTVADKGYLLNQDLLDEGLARRF